MIDTDKYTGHTPAPWDGILSGYFTIEELKGIDKTLMQDAPLLLAEVERLQYLEMYAPSFQVFALNEKYMVEEYTQHTSVNE